MSGGALFIGAGPLHSSRCGAGRQGQTPEQYAHSGHHAYVWGKGGEVIEAAKVLGTLGGSRAYRGFIQGGVRAGHREEHYGVAGKRFLGDQDFAEAMGAGEGDVAAPLLVRDATTLRTFLVRMSDRLASDMREKRGIKRLEKMIES